MALHHAGASGNRDWDEDKVWSHGFNQGIPLGRIVAALRAQLDEGVLAELGLPPNG